MLEKVDEYAETTDALLIEPGHGIPTVAEVKLEGRTVQEKN